jgi:DNA-binding CsgD family transcriptional regulator
MLIGRTNECKVLDDLLASARKCEGDAIVVQGEPGIGKTALIEYAIASATDFVVLRTGGNEAEMELPFAAFHELCRPAMGSIGNLPDPQRKAVEVVLGMREGEALDRLLVALALLNLLSELGSKRPVLCVIDDTQWLDDSSADAIAFAARHVSKDAVGFLFGARALTDEVRGLPSLTIGGLGDRDARALLATVLPDRLDDRVVDRLVAESHGNPLALLDLPRGLTPSQLAGGFALPVSVTLSGQIEESYCRRIAKLPPDSRRLLLIAAADPTGDSEIIWRAADKLGITEDAVSAVEEDGLVDLSDGLVFHHPLVRSAVYKTASPKSRREAHLALAEATDSGIDPDRRAWHRAQATLRPNEDVAAELDASAERAQRRGGFAAAGAFLERSVELTIDPTRRSSRALRAAETMRLTGALDAAMGLAAIAERGPLDDLQRARLDVLCGQIAFTRNRGSDASEMMLKAANRLQHIDTALARDAYLDALTAASFSGRLARSASTQAVAKAARAAPNSEQPARASDLLLDGLSLLITDGYKSGTSVLRRAIAEFETDSTSVDQRLRWSWLAGGAASLIWDHEAWYSLTARGEQLARDVGALSVLSVTLGSRARACLFAGEVAEVASLADQLDVVTQASDSTRLPNISLALAAFRGDEPGTRQLIEVTRKGSLARGEGLALTVALWAEAFLYNGLGRYEEAFCAAAEALDDPDGLWYSGWATVEFIESATRTGRSAQARPAFEQLEESTEASGTDWALGVQARCRALLSDNEEAEGLYNEAIDRLLPTRLALDVSRARLLYGEWLRRQQRQRDARDQLRRAHEVFVELEMSAFANRAEAELLATGERARKRTVDTHVDLTPQESRISRIAAEGATNQEIAGQLFISTATVEYHLSKVYRKLGIRSRTQLANTLLQSQKAG